LIYAPYGLNCVAPVTAKFINAAFELASKKLTELPVIAAPRKSAILTTVALEATSPLGETRAGTGNGTTKTPEIVCGADPIAK
jgi:hypothetical protein